MFTDLGKSFMRKCYIHADHLDEARNFFSLVILDDIAVFQDTFDSFNERYEFVEVCSEFLGIGDLEEHVELGLLRKATPMK